MAKLRKPLLLDEQLCFNIYSASLALNRMYKPLLDGFGITYPQFLVLSVLNEQDEQTIGMLAERLALESSTITPLVKRLELAGFVRRVRNRHDERQVIVTLTPKARALYHDTKCLSETLLVNSELAPADLLRLNREISALRDALVRNSAPARRADGEAA